MSTDITPEPAVGSATTSDILERLARHILVPVVVIDDAADADALGAALVDGGLPVAEVTFRTPAAADAIRVLRDRGDVLVGAGTVLTPAQVDQAVAAGASYVVSPGTSRAVVERCLERGVLPLPGAVTATEVQAALELGLSTVKFFPAATSGGPAAIAALAAPFGDVRFVPTGGIGPGNLDQYLALSCVAAVGGSWMVPACCRPRARRPGDPDPGRRRRRPRRGPAYPLIPTKDEPMTDLLLRPASECAYDAVALGEVMLRLDPGEGRIRTARQFRASEGGGEYNVARGLRRAFGLRAAIVTALADNEVGRLVEDCILTGGLDTSFIRWSAVRRRRTGVAQRSELHRAWLRRARRGRRLRPRAHGGLPARTRRHRLGAPVR